MPSEIHREPLRATDGMIVIQPALRLPAEIDERWAAFRVFAVGIVGLLGMTSVIIAFGALTHP